MKAAPRTHGRSALSVALWLTLPAVLMLLAGCTGGDDPSPQPPANPAALRLAPDCPPPPDQRQATSAEQLNRLVASIDLPAWQSGDIGASGRLHDGRLVWLFGDTTHTAAVPPPLVANSMLVSSGRCIAQLRGEGDGPVIPDVSSRVVRWPMSVAIGRQDGHDVVLVLCSRIDRGSAGSFGFTFLGTSAAVFTVEAGQAPQLDRVVDLTPDSRDEQQINWGAAATIAGGSVYVYGTRLTGEAYDFGRELYVARAPAADPGSRDRWRFWDGTQWQPKAGRAAAVLPSKGGVSQTLSVDSIGGEFVAVSKRDGDVSDFVYKWTAPDPWGPWTPVEEVKEPGGFDTGKLKYAPLAHPEILLKSGLLLASVSRNTTDLDALLAHPDIGRPEFVELPR
jgi:hypothetical protein